MSIIKYLTCILMTYIIYTDSAYSAVCNMNVTGVNFGYYDVFDPISSESSGFIDVVCDTDTGITIQVSTGNGEYTAREMHNGIHKLYYNLYINSARTNILGDGTQGTSYYSGFIKRHIFDIYGRIPALQNVYVGFYTDIIIVTLNF